MRHPDKRNVGGGDIILWTAEQGWHPPPIEIVHHACIMLFGHLPVPFIKNHQSR
jgi:hypothetical protein